jgi:hypothetical protein
VTAGIIRADDPEAGALFVQGRIDDGTGHAGLLDDVVGVGWRLVTMHPDLAGRLPTDALARFAGIGGRVVAVAAADDVDGTYTSWFTEHEVAAVLQRPDFHLFGSAAEPGDAGALLDDLHRSLTSPADATDFPAPDALTP